MSVHRDLEKNNVQVIKEDGHEDKDSSEANVIELLELGSSHPPRFQFLTTFLQNWGVETHGHVACSLPYVLS